MKVSVICVYNDKRIFETQLNASLQNQEEKYELIAIDNTEKEFQSAAEALNYGARIATGNVLVFSHQDIYLKGTDELKKLAKIICSCPTGTIVGTQGVKECSKKYFSNITAGDDYISDINEEYDEKLYPVSCVDEGFFGMTIETWKNHPFDEKLCDNWHLYCVESCLYARKNGAMVYVWPTQLHHFSMGNISVGYMNNLRRLCKVYRKEFKYIWTTCYKVRTNWLYIQGLYWAWVINRFIRGKLY